MHSKRIIATVFALILSISPVSVVRAVTASDMVNLYPSVARVNTSTDTVIKIRSEIAALLADGKHRDYPGAMLAEDHNKIMWWKGMEIWALSDTLPFLDDATRIQMSAFLKTDIQNTLMNQTYRDFELKGSLSTKIPDSQPDWWQWQGVEWEGLYGMWAYAYNTGDWSLIQSNWSTISSIYQNLGASPANHKKFVDSIYVKSYNSEIAGRIAYARMAKKLYALTGTSSYQSTYTSTLSSVSSRLSILQTAVGYSALEGHICNFEGTQLCPLNSGAYQDPARILHYDQFDFLTPELGRHYHDTYQSVILPLLADSDTKYPFWYMSTYNLVLDHDEVFGLAYAGGEGYFQMPDFSYEMFQAKALIADASTTELNKKLPWVNELASVPHYWDILNYLNLVTLLRRQEAVVWADTNTTPVAAVVNLTATPTPVPTGTPSPACAADINQDHIVDISDYSILVANFFKSPLSNSRADINQDGIVDISDYSKLVASFFQSCN